MRAVFGGMTGRSMSRVCAVIVRILKLTFHPDMDAERRNFISEFLRGDIYCSSGYIV